MILIFFAHTGLRKRRRRRSFMKVFVCDAIVVKKNVIQS